MSTDQISFRCSSSSLLGQFASTFPSRLGPRHWFHSWASCWAAAEPPSWAEAGREKGVAMRQIKTAVLAVQSDFISGSSIIMEVPDSGEKVSPAPGKGQWSSPCYSSRKSVWMSRSGKKPRKTTISPFQGGGPRNVENRGRGSHGFSWILMESPDFPRILGERARRSLWQ